MPHSYLAAAHARSARAVPSTAHEPLISRGASRAKALQPGSSETVAVAAALARRRLNSLLQIDLAAERRFEELRRLMEEPPVRVPPSLWRRAPWSC